MSLVAAALLGLGLGAGAGALAVASRRDWEIQTNYLTSSGSGRVTSTFGPSGIQTQFNVNATDKENIPEVAKAVAQAHAETARAYAVQIQAEAQVKIARLQYEQALLERQIQPILALLGEKKGEVDPKEQARLQKLGELKEVAALLSLP